MITNEQRPSLKATPDFGDGGGGGNMWKRSERKFLTNFGQPTWNSSQDLVCFAYDIE